MGILGEKTLADMRSSTNMGWNHTSTTRMVAATLFIAGAIRLYFLTGFQGTDDLVFAKVAYNVAHGNLAPGTYIGTLRYGFNFPLAAATNILGFNEYSLVLYPLLTSLISILGVYLIGEQLYGREVGVTAAVLLAFCPLDIIWSGRIQADAPLLMFMVLSCVAFFGAMKRTRHGRMVRWLFFASGVLLGLGYTTKNVAIFLWPLFVFLAWYGSIGLGNLMWVVGGFLAIFAAEAAFFFWQTGDPLYTFTVQSLHNKKVADMVFNGTTSDLISWPLAYPYWAFFGFQHVGLTFYLAAFAWAVYIFRKTSVEPEHSWANRVLLVWFVSLLLILTFYVMSWKPFVLIWKQSNYILMFLPPLLLLTAYCIRDMPANWKVVLIIVYASTSLLFAGVEREVLAAESSNARAIARWYLEEGRGMPLYCQVRDCGMVSLLSGYEVESRMIPYDDPFGNVSDMADLASVRHGVVAINKHLLKRSSESVSIQNQEIIKSPPTEWKLVKVFKHETYGVLYWGRRVVAEMSRSGAVPQSFMNFVDRKIREAVEPDTVSIYQVGKQRQHFYGGIREGL